MLSPLLSTMVVLLPRLIMRTPVKAKQIQKNFNAPELLLENKTAQNSQHNGPGIVDRLGNLHRQPRIANKESIIINKEHEAEEEAGEKFFFVKAEKTG